MHLYKCIQVYVSCNTSVQQFSHLTLKSVQAWAWRPVALGIYILKRQLLKDVPSPFIPSLWKLLNSKAKHFLSIS